MRQLARFWLLLAAAGAALLLLAAPATAHAVVVGSDPADGSRLASVPARVSIRFDEPVGLDLGYLRVVDSSGHRVDTGTATHPAGDGTAISVQLRSGLGDDSYLASYRVTSADSHPVAGSIRFVVGNGALTGGSGPAGSAPDDASVSALLATSHWLSFAGVGVVGGSWLLFWLWPAGRRRLAVRRLIWTGWTAAVLGALGEFLLQGPYAAGTGLASARRPSLIDATLHADSGQLLSVRVVLIGLVGGVLTALFTGRRSDRVWVDEPQLADSAAGGSGRIGWLPEAAAVLGAGIVVTFAASGHSQSANPRWLAVLVDALHLTAMVVWLGGLAVLLTAGFSRRLAGQPTDEDGDLAELSAGLPVFSRIALCCVCTLAITGTIQAWREVGALDAITTTRYGQLVLIKVVLFGGLVGLGYLARRVLQAPAAGRGAVFRLRRTLLIEVTVGAVVLAVTGVLISQPPGKVALAAAHARPRSTTVPISANSRAVVAVDPGVHGTVAITIRLDGGTSPSKVSASASLPAKQLGPIPVQLKAVGSNSFTGSGVLLPVAGMWQVSVTVQTSEFDSTTAVAAVRIY
ncbi:MAG TPA: copper resistance protein CopC [Jatrophihabitans sp.]|nr:copper resistance protein CopC [Jatrophihabitans sp.]